MKFEMVFIFFPPANNMCGIIQQISRANSTISHCLEHAHTCTQPRPRITDDAPPPPFFPFQHFGGWATGRGPFRWE